MTNPVYEAAKTEAKDSSSTLNVTNPVYEAAKAAEEEGDYVAMEDIDTEEAEHIYDVV